MRTEYCGNTDTRFLGQTVTLFGWAHRRRDHGGVIFIDLRDREGLVQVVCDPDRAETFATADRVRHEFVLRAKGLVRPRPAGTVNPNLKSGEIEVLAHDLEILNAAQTPPFMMDDEQVSEEVRLKYRFLDLRRPAMQRILRMRHATARAVREYLDENGFVDVETPVLYKSTPEGAREFLVPLAPARRPLLRAAAVAAALQADPDGGGLRPLLPDREVLPRRGPARRPAARVHADRHRDLVPRRARDPGHHGGPDPPRVETRAGRGPSPVPPPDLRGSH